MSKDGCFEEVTFRIEIYLPINKSWNVMSPDYKDLESAQCAVHENETSDMRFYGKKMDYRIMKYTIKKERVG